MKKKVGILAVHGSKEEHAYHMQRLGYEVVMVKTPDDIQDIQGIIFPGGESTSFGRLMQWNGLYDALQKKITDETLPVFGTCAGAILLSSEGSDFSMNLLPIQVERNAYGSQVDSFSEEIFIDAIDDWVHCIFIRAPKIRSVGAEVHVLASYNHTPILVEYRSKNIIACTFHPELTASSPIHEYFSTIIQSR